MSPENEQLETTTTETPATTEESTEALPASEESSEETGPTYEDPDFGAITDFVEGDVEEEILPVAAEAEETVETPVEEIPPEVEAAAPEPSEGEEIPEETVETEPEPVEEPPVVEPEPELAKLPTREDLEGLYAAHREKTLPELEKVFTLSDEEAAALDEQPSKVLPKLAAQLQYDVMMSTYNAVIQALPTVMGTFNKANDVATQAHTKFMETWPDLNSKKAEPIVKAAIQAYRASNPRASLEDTIKNAGVMAMINAGFDPTKTKEAMAPKPKRKVAPPKPVAPTGANPEPPVVKQESNEFAELAEVFLNEMS